MQMGQLEEAVFFHQLIHVAVGVVRVDGQCAIDREQQIVENHFIIHIQLLKRFS
ncbi:hypothetical protein D3C74_471870 [compost metagenome]